MYGASSLTLSETRLSVSLPTTKGRLELAAVLVVEQACSTGVWGVVWSLWFRYGLELHWCVACVSGVVNPLPKQQTITICGGHEDLSSC